MGIGTNQTTMILTKTWIFISLTWQWHLTHLTLILVIFSEMFNSMRLVNTVFWLPRQSMAVSRIMGPPLSDQQWEQAKLPVHMGGLGIRGAEDHGPVAYAVSYLSSRPLVPNCSTSTRRSPQSFPRSLWMLSQTDKVKISRLLAWWVSSKKLLV